MNTAPPAGTAEKIVTLWVVLYVLFTLATVIAVVIFDAWAIWHKERSVTETIRQLAHNEPMLVAAWAATHGVLCAHLFWSR